MTDKERQFLERIKNIGVTGGQLERELEAIGSQPDITKTRGASEVPTERTETQERMLRASLDSARQVYKRPERTESMLSTTQREGTVLPSTKRDDVLKNLPKLSGLQPLSTPKPLEIKTPEQIKLEQQALTAGAMRFDKPPQIGDKPLTGVIPTQQREQMPVAVPELAQAKIPTRSETVEGIHKAGSYVGNLLGEVIGFGLGSLLSLTQKRRGEDIKDTDIKTTTPYAIEQDPTKPSVIENMLKEGEKMSRGMGDFSAGVVGGGVTLYPAAIKTFIDIAEFTPKIIAGKEDAFIDYMADEFLKVYYSAAPKGVVTDGELGITTKQDAPEITKEQAKNYLLTGNFEGDFDNINRDEVTKAWLAPMINLGIDLYIASSLATSAYNGYYRRNPDFGRTPGGHLKIEDKVVTMSRDGKFQSHPTPANWPTTHGRVHIGEGKPSFGRKLTQDITSGRQPSTYSSQFIPDKGTGGEAYYSGGFKHRTPQEAFSIAMAHARTAKAPVKPTSPLQINPWQRAGTAPTTQIKPTSVGGKTDIPVDTGGIKIAPTTAGQKTSIPVDTTQRGVVEPVTPTKMSGKPIQELKPEVRSAVKNIESSLSDTGFKGVRLTDKTIRDLINKQPSPFGADIANKQIIINPKELASEIKALKTKGVELPDGEVTKDLPYYIQEMVKFEQQHLNNATIQDMQGLASPEKSVRDATIKSLDERAVDSYIKQKGTEVSKTPKEAIKDPVVKTPEAKPIGEVKPTEYKVSKSGDEYNVVDTTGRVIDSHPFKEAAQFVARKINETPIGDRSAMISSLRGGEPVKSAPPKVSKPKEATLIKKTTTQETKDNLTEEAKKFKTFNRFVNSEFNKWFNKLSQEEKVKMTANTSARIDKFNSLEKELTPIWDSIKTEVKKKALPKKIERKAYKDAMIKGGELILPGEKIEYKGGIVWGKTSGYNEGQLIKNLEGGLAYAKRFPNDKEIIKSANIAKNLIHDIKMASPNWGNYKSLFTSGKATTPKVTPQKPVSKPSEKKTPSQIFKEMAERSKAKKAKEIKKPEPKKSKPKKEVEPKKESVSSVVKRINENNVKEVVKELKEAGRSVQFIESISDSLLKTNPSLATDIIAEMTDRYNVNPFELKKGGRVSIDNFEHLSDPNHANLTPTEDRLVSIKRVKEFGQLHKQMYEMIKKVTGGELKLTTSRMPKGAVGFYQDQAKVIGVKSLLDMGTVGHELAHYLDRKHDLIDNLIKKEIEDVIGHLRASYFMYYPGAKKKAPKETQLREGFASFIQEMISFPTRTQVKHSTLVDYFLKPSGGGYIDISTEAISGFQDIISKYHKLGPEHQEIVKTGEIAKALKGDGFWGNIKSIDLYTEGLNFTHRLSRYAQRIGKRRESSDSPSTWLNTDGNQRMFTALQFEKPGEYRLIDNDGEIRVYHKINPSKLIDMVVNKGLDVPKDALGKEKSVIKRNIEDIKALNFNEWGVFLLARQWVLNNERFTKLSARSESGEKLAEFEENFLEEFPSLKKNEGVDIEKQYKIYNNLRKKFKNEENIQETHKNVFLDYLRDMGVINRETANTYKAIKGYVPSKKEQIDETYERNLIKSLPKQRSGMSAFLKRKGSEKQTLHPSLSQLINSYTATSDATLSESLRKYYHLAKNEKGKIQIVEIKKAPIGYHRPKVIANQATFLDGDKLVTIRMNKQDALAYQRHINSRNITTFEVISRTMAGIFSKITIGPLWLSFTFYINTMLNSIQGLANAKESKFPTLDGWKTLIGAAEYGLKNKLLSPDDANLLNNLVKKSSKAMKFLRLKLSEDFKKSSWEYVNNYFETGGIQGGYSTFLDIPDLDVALRGGKGSRGIGTKILTTTNKAFKTISWPTIMVEHIERIGEGHRAILNGKSFLESLELSQGVSVPLKGTGGYGWFLPRLLSNISAFFKVGTKAPLRWILSMQDKETRTRSLMTTGILAMLAYLSSLYFKKDFEKQSKEDQEKIRNELGNASLWQRANSHPVLLKDGNVNWIRTPAGYNQAAIMVSMLMTEAMYDIEYSNSEYATVGTMGLLPDPNQMTGQLGKLWLALGFNKKTFPVISDVEPSWTNHMDSHQKFRADTNDLAYFLGQTTLGKGAKLSPIQIEFIIKNMGGRGIDLISKDIADGPQTIILNWIGNLNPLPENDRRWVGREWNKIYELQRNMKNEHDRIKPHRLEPGSKERNDYEKLVWEKAVVDRFLTQASSLKSYESRIDLQLPWVIVSRMESIAGLLSQEKYVEANNLYLSNEPLFRDTKNIIDSFDSIKALSPEEKINSFWNAWKTKRIEEYKKQEGIKYLF